MNRPSDAHLAHEQVRSSKKCHATRTTINGDTMFAVMSGEDCHKQ